MALRVMSAIVSGTHNVNTSKQNVGHCTEKLKLQESLLTAAKQCHFRFGGKTELATESDSCVKQLCCIFEEILSHGLKVHHNNSEKLNLALRHVSELVKVGLASNNLESFWPFVRSQLTWHEQERFSSLRKVQTDQGQGRAWLRAALNERSLERHFHSILGPEILDQYYEDWAFLRDQDKSSLLPNVAAGLTTILFAIRIDNEEFDHFLDKNKSFKILNHNPEPVIDSTFPEPSTSSKTRKKVQTHIISFEDDDDLDNVKNNIILKSSCSTNSILQNLEIEKNIIDLSLPSSSITPQINSESINIVFDVKPISWSEREIIEEERLLTPLTDVENMGGLVPVSPLDNPLDDVLINLPCYIEDSTTTEAAVEATEPFVNEPAEVDLLDIKSLRTQLSTLNEVLEQSREDTISSKLQLARLQRQHQNYLEKHELQIQTLNRENELLRQQLRKYVTAVQMLKKDSDTDTASEMNDVLDYHKESEEYQYKLIQVAEMHAELMEFNARLTIQLAKKEKLVKLLQAELESLRGPLYEEDLPSEVPNLIHIWVPSAFLTGQSSDIHHVYQIYIRIRDAEWNIYRRYAQFYSLYRDLKKNDAVVTSFDFPPKKTLGNKDAKFVEERRQKLQLWLRRVVHRFSHCSPAFQSSPSKQTLISLMPFFGDFPNIESKASHSVRNPYSTSPQYNGL